MLALAFRAGDADLAIAVRHIVEVLPRVPLRPPLLAPPSVLGLLPFRGVLAPVVDLCHLVTGAPAAHVLGTRIIVVQIVQLGAQRVIGILAENVSELIECGPTTAGLHLREHAWLGEHLETVPGLPQLVDPAELLPDALQALFIAAPAPDAESSSLP